MRLQGVLAMAKVTMPALSQGASGKVGDVVFFRRWGSNVARIRVKPANPRTFKQTTVRHNLSALSQAWKGSGDLVLQDDATGTATGTPNALYVVLKQYDPATNTTTDVNFIVLDQTEKDAWITYAQNLGKPTPWGRLYFIGQNISLLMSNQAPVRTP